MPEINYPVSTKELSLRIATSFLGMRQRETFRRETPFVNRCRLHLHRSLLWCPLFLCNLLVKLMCHRQNRK